MESAVQTAPPSVSGDHVMVRTALRDDGLAQSAQYRGVGNMVIGAADFIWFLLHYIRIFLLRAISGCELFSAIIKVRGNLQRPCVCHGVLGQVVSTVRSGQKYTATRTPCRTIAAAAMKGVLPGMTT